jgi:heme-degrading monooxygenase HmoA
MFYSKGEKSMFIAVNTIAGAGGNERMLQGFRHAAPAMKQFKGFLGLEIWTAPDGSMQAISRWTSQEALDEYLTNPLFSSHHGGVSSEQMNIPNQIFYYTAEVLE